MTSDELEAILAVTLPAARDAGALVATGFRRRPEVEHKGAIDLVTSYDRDSETLLRERLRPLGIAVFGEEQGGERPEGAPVLYVDPLDGTTNFVHGHPFWCVSIGLACGSDTVLGVVVAPSLGLEWYGWVAADGTRAAVRRSGSTEEPCVPTATDRLDDALLATGFPYDRRTSPDDNLDAFAALLKQCQGVRRCGSAAIDLCSVADGTYDGYWERKLGPWDLAGGAAIVRGAGGRVTDFEGGASFLAQTGPGRIVATNGPLHAMLTGALARVHTR